MLVYDFLNLRGVGLECFKVSVLRKNLNPVLALWPSIASTLGVELVHSVHWACRCRQYAMVCVVRHVSMFLTSIIRIYHFGPRT